MDERLVKALNRFRQLYGRLVEKGDEEFLKLINHRVIIFKLPLTNLHRDKALSLVRKYTEILKRKR